MLDKIDFKPGVLLSSLFLNQIQKSPSFDYFQRENFFGLPDDSSEALWPIGQRDSLKDWELPNPQLEPETNIGRLAFDGIILGCNGCEENSVITPEIIFGPPTTIRKDPFSGGLLENNAWGIIVNAGRVLNKGKIPIQWETQVVLIEPGTVNYIYISLSADNILAVSSNKFPSRAKDFIPLAILDIDETGEIIQGVDVRRNLYIDNLEYTDLTNSDIIYSNLLEPVELWKRNLVDTANGSLVLNLPDNVSDSDRIGFLDLAGSFARNPLRIQVLPESENSIHGNQFLDIDIKDAHISLVYLEALKEWRIENTDFSSDSDALGKFISCGGQYCIGTTDAADCPNGFAIPPVFPNESEGFYRYVPETDTTGKCYKVLNNSIAVYSDGNGGFIQVNNAQRCGGQGDIRVPRDEFATLYVDQSLGDDSLVNNGEDKNVPFRTIERALLQAAKREKNYSINVAPGEYYVDNSPGSIAIITGRDGTGYHNLIDTERTVFNFNPRENYLVISEGDDDSFTEPPRGFEVGRVIYGKSGAVANIKSIRRKKICAKECGWIINLIHRKGIFSKGEKIFNNRLDPINSVEGGIIVPHGTSIIGDDLRKTIIRPLYVPLTEAYDGESYLFKLTNNSYVKNITISDNDSITRSHNRLTAFGFASESDLEEKENSFPYFRKIFFFWKDDTLDPFIEKDGLDIVAITPREIIDKHRDVQENMTGRFLPDSSSENDYINIPGKITRFTIDTNQLIKIPDINSTRNSSPYIQNCSVRSSFGMNGAHADGNLVRGFKSILVSGFTQVSIQVDVDAYLPETYFSEPFDASFRKKYKPNYRHYGFKTSNGGYMQIVNCFAIGNTDHFVSETGGEMSILSCASNFGDKALVSSGYSPRALIQDKSEETIISEIIPPKPLNNTYAEKRQVDSGLLLAKEPTYLFNSNNSEKRIYVRNKNNFIEFDENSVVPSPPEIFSYTKKDNNGEYILSNESNGFNGFSIFGVSGVEYFSRVIELSDDPNLGDNSKIFFWDPNPPYEIDLIGQVLSNGERIVSKEMVSPIEAQEFLDYIGPIGQYLLINNLVYQLKDKYSSNNTVYLEIDRNLPPTNIQNNLYQISKINSDYLGGLWYLKVDSIPSMQSLLDNLINIEDKSTLFLPRMIDKRELKDRIYHVKIKGFLPQQGKRNPKNFYILEEQSSINIQDPGLNKEDEDPLVLTNIQEINDGEFIANLVFSKDARKTLTDDIYYDINVDNIYLTEDPEWSITKKAINKIYNRTNYFILNNLEELVEVPTPGEYPHNIYYMTSNKRVLIELRKPSIIRASNHTWEWTGFLNYETALPSLQVKRIPPQEKYQKMINESLGGRIFATGMDEDGEYFYSSSIKNLDEILHYE